MTEINATIEWPDGEYVQFEDYEEARQAYDQITELPGFVGPLTLVDLR